MRKMNLKLSGFISIVVLCATFAIKADADPANDNYDQKAAGETAMNIGELPQLHQYGTDDFQLTADNARMLVVQKIKNVLPYPEPTLNPPSPGLLVGELHVRLKLLGRKLYLGRRLGSYRFVFNAIMAGRRHTGTQVVMRLGPNAFELYECTVDLRSQVGKGSHGEMYTLDIPELIINRDPRAVIFLLGDSNYYDSFEMNKDDRASWPNISTIEEIAPHDPDKAIELLGDLDYANWQCRGWPAVVMSLMKKNRLDEAAGLLREAPSEAYPSLILHEMTALFLQREDVDAAIRLRREFSEIGGAELDDEFWADIAEHYLHHGNVAAAIETLQSAKAPPDGTFIHGCIEKAKYDVVLTLVKAQRHDDARTLAAGMSSYLDGRVMYLVPGGDSFERLHALKARAYQDIIVSMSAHGRIDEARRLLEQEFPRNDSEEAREIFQAVQHILETL